MLPMCYRIIYYIRDREVTDSKTRLNDRRVEFNNFPVREQRRSVVPPIHMLVSKAACQVPIRLLYAVAMKLGINFLPMT
jgi:hypothetical protein